jgi:hypothetical protein
MSRFHYGDVQLSGIAHMEGRHAGETCVVLCPGPTLSDYRDKGIPPSWKRVAVDGAIERLGAKADYWVVSDVPVVEAFAQHCPETVTVLAMHEATTVVGRLLPSHEVHTVTSMPAARDYGNGFEFFSRGTVAIGAVEMGRYLGFLRFFVIGLDLFDPRGPAQPRSKKGKPRPWHKEHRGRFDLVQTRAQRRAAQRIDEVMDAGLWQEVEVYAVGALAAQHALPRLDWEELHALTRGRTLAREGGELAEKKLQREKVRALRNAGAGRILVVVASGPSVNEVDLTPLKEHALVDTLSINTPHPALNPTTYWAFCDDDVYDRDPELFHTYPGVILNSWNVRAARPEVLNAENQVLIPYVDEMSLPFSRNLLQGYVLGKSTTYASLQTALWMNYDKVFVFGCDMCRPPGAKHLHFQGGLHEMEPGEREERFALEAEHYLLAARHLTPTERSKFIFCSAYNPWPFLRYFGHLDHREAVEHVLRLASVLEGLSVAAAPAEGPIGADEVPAFPPAPVEEVAREEPEESADGAAEVEEADAPLAGWRVEPPESAPARIESVLDLPGGLRRLYVEHADSQQLLMERCSASAEAAIEAVTIHPPASLDMADLDAYPSAFTLARLLAHLPPDVVADELGAEALLWAWVHCPPMGEDDPIARRLLDAMRRRFGWQELQLRKARRAVSELGGARSARAVLRTYRMLVAASRRELLDGAHRLDLAGLLRGCWERGTPTEEVLSRYGLEPLQTSRDEPEGWARGWGFHVVSRRQAIRIMLDAPLALALTYRGLPRALVAVACADPETLTVHQLQGVRVGSYDRDLVGIDGKEGVPPGLKVLRRKGGQGLGGVDWQRALVGCAGALGRAWGFERLLIRSGRKNRWIHPWREDGKVHLPLDKALEKYDAVAERLGFEPTEGGDWVLGLDEASRPELVEVES